MTKPPSSAGRPPGPHDHTLAKVLPTAMRLFVDEGGAALTPTRLHKETGVARATIYRNWPDPTDLLEIMLTLAAGPGEPAADLTGDVRSDLQSAMDDLIARFVRPDARAYLGACIEYGRRSERIAPVAGSYIAGILQPIRSVICDAVESGRLAGDTDELVAELTGPVVVEHLLLGQPVDEARGRRLVEHFLSHHPPRTTRRRSRTRARARASVDA